VKIFILPRERRLKKQDGVHAQPLEPTNF